MNLDIPTPDYALGDRVAYDTDPDPSGTVLSIEAHVYYSYTIKWDDIKEPVDEYLVEMLDHVKNPERGRDFDPTN